jgi:hypothetical protein
MKKILNEWKIFLKEDSDISKDDLLDKVREVFFGAYNSWSEEYKKLHDSEFEEKLKQIEHKAEEIFDDSEKIGKVARAANIGLSLYWSDNQKHGAGSPDMAKYLIARKLDILESILTKEEKEALETGFMQQIIDSVRQDRSNQVYPTSLAVSVGVINGIQVHDAYMTTPEGINRFVVPILSNRGYYNKTNKQPVVPRKKRRKNQEPEMSLADMKAMMDKFGR